MIFSKNNLFKFRLSRSIWIKFNEIRCINQNKNGPKIYLYHIRKTGGTSLIYSFLSLSGEPSQLYNKLQRNICLKLKDKVFVGWNNPIIGQGKFFFAFSHSASHQIILPEETFTITCLRDPCQRVISHYKMLFLAQNNPEYISRFRLYQEMKWLGNSFDDFLTNIPKEHLLRQLYMFSEKFDVEEAYDKVIDCSYFFFTENFSLGLEELSLKLNLDLHQYQANKSSQSISVNRSSLEKLQALLKPEYLLYERLKKKKALE